MLRYILLLVPLCNGYNILLSVPAAEKSETTLVFETAAGLLDAGHYVTLITGFKWSKTHENLSQLCISEIQKASEVLEGDPTDWEADIFGLIAKYYTMKNKILWEDKRVMEIWKKRKTFDLFLTLSYYSESSFPFLMDNDIPFAQLITPGSELTALLRDGHLLSPSLSPSLLVKYDEIMTFWERTLNLKSTFEFYFGQTKAAREYMKPVIEVFPNLGDFERYYERISLTLINSHFALDSPIPLLPNQIEIGAIHCSKKVTPLEKLDKDLAAFVEGSGEAGIIYFSLGSIAQSAHLSQEAKDALLEAFRRIPQRVLWKYEDENFVVPPNVFIKKWMPQQDILAHPKTKVFISHCGTLGTQEAKYHGVPVLGIPMGFDQPRNCAKMLRKGHALTLSWDGLTAEQIVDSLNVLVNDTSYKLRMEGLSKILQDQKETPKERAIWWLEYIIRHKGAPHLQYAGKSMSVFQYIMLDVLLFWLALFIFLIFSFVYVVRFIFFGKRSKNGAENLSKNKQKNTKKMQ